MHPLQSFLVLSKSTLNVTQVVIMDFLEDGAVSVQLTSGNTHHYVEEDAEKLRRLFHEPARLPAPDLGERASVETPDMPTEREVAPDPAIAKATAEPEPFSEPQPESPTE